MTKTIWKQELEITDEQAIEIPQNAQFLTVQMQNNTPCIWFMCASDLPKRKFLIRCYGTGHEVDDDTKRLNYLGTIQTGPLVFHYFMKAVIIS